VRAIAALAAQAPSNRAFREGTIDLVVPHVAFDAAIFHALSPRVPLSTAAIRGLDVGELAKSMVKWDAWAVEFGRFRDLAIAQDGVVTDREALPIRGRSRALFERAFGAEKRARAVAFVHLMVRSRIVSGLVLVRYRSEPFSVADVRLLRAIAGVMAVGDALHQGLDGAAQASVPVRLRCVDGRLTEGEREIVERVALGHTNLDIAAALGKSPNTIRNQLAGVMRKLAASNRADVVRLAVLR
jgi:DNA-binding CsgD family transcriptional regulator